MEAGKVVRAMPSWYEIESEKVLDLDGRKIAYTVGQGVVDNSCCGRYGCRFATVMGFVDEKSGNLNHAKANHEREYRSITDELWQNRVSEAIYKEETVDQIQFL